MVKMQYSQAFLPPRRPLRDDVFVGMGDGSFEHAPELIDGTIAVRSPIVVADDFNSG